MVTPDYFNHPPSSDRTIGVPDKWVRPAGTFRNGYFQHILWLGVNGFVIINHFSPKEILLVDPWPSYRRCDAMRGTRSPRRRITYLVNWLRASVAKGYHLGGILISHRHFDHIDDVPAILELLTLGAGKSHRARNISHRFHFNTPAVPVSALPPVFADHVAIKDIRDKNDASGSLLRLEEITTKAGSTLDYQSLKPAKCPPCGTELATFNAGGFEVTPYVWDHMNLTDTDANLLGMPGNKQKMSGLQVRWKHVPNAKRTFILGSAGEMNSAYTAGDILPNPPRIETDTLIQSITYPGAPHYRQQLNATVDYQVKYLQALDYVLPTHWENYFFGPPKPVRRSKGFYQNHQRVDEYLKVWQKALEQRGYPTAEAQKEVSKLTSMRRLRFEYDAVPNPCNLTWS